MPAALPLKPFTHTLVFRKLASILKADPTLRRVVTTWRAWEGDADDAAPPTPEECPWVRLTPIGKPAGIEAIGVTDSSLTIKLELVCAGSNLDDAMNLWGAVVACLNPPSDNSVYAAINDLGATGQPVIEQPGYSVMPSEKGVMLAAAGSFSVLVLLNT